ncbi:DUF2723 domain-containing protein [bacterium]|nr:DUF2723 domain-containing protein [bacterium]
MKRFDPILWVVFCLPLAIYIFQLCPTVYVHDSGELITAAYVLGIAHPAGSPTYCLVGKLLQLLLPVGPIAFQLNAMSAFWAALSVLLFYVLIRAILGNMLISLSCAWIFAFSLTFWSQALVAEVYTLMICLLLCACFLIHSFSQNDDPRILYCFGYIWGLLMTVHMEFTLMTPLIWLVIGHHLVERKHGLGTIKALFWLSFFFLVGLLPYLYLPLRSVHNPVIDWGNPETMALFIDHLTARTVQQRMFALDWVDYVPRLTDYVRIILEDTCYLGLAGMVGLVLPWPNKNVLRYLLLIVLIIDAGFVVLLDQVPIQSEAYAIPSVLAVCLGLAGLGQKIAQKQEKLHVLGLILPALLLILNGPQLNRNSNFIVSDHALNIVYQVPPGSTIFSREDNTTFVLLYHHVVEKRRSDLTLFDTAHNVFHNPYGRLFHLESPSQILAIRQNVEEKIVHQKSKAGLHVLYTDLELPFSTTEFELEPCGILGLAYRNSSPSIGPTWCNPITSLRGEHDPAVTKDWMTRAVLAMFYYKLAQSRWLTEPDLARKSLKLAATRNDAYPELQYMIGRSFQKHGLIEDAIAQYERAQFMSKRLWQASVQLAYLRAQQGDYGRAMKNAKQALAYNATQPEIHQIIALILAKQGKHVEAEQYFQQALSHDPQSYQISYNFVRFYLDRNDYRKGELLLLEKRDLFPENTQFLELLFQAQAGQSSWQSARDTAAALCALDPDSHSAKIMLAQAFLGLHQDSQACELLKQVLEQEPDHEQALAFHQRCGERP